MCRFQPSATRCSHVQCNCDLSSPFDQFLASHKPTKRHFGNNHQQSSASVAIFQNLNLNEKKPKIFSPVILSNDHMIKTEPTQEKLITKVSLPMLPQHPIPQLPSFDIVFKSLGKPEEKQVEEAKLMEAFNFLLAQQNAITEMTNQEETLEQTILNLTQELVIIRSNFEQKMKITKIQEKQAAESKLVATTEMLLAQMYPKTPEFLYALRAIGDFPQLLCREKHFTLNLELIDLRSGTRVVNPNKIDVSLALYTATNPPKLISINTTGEKPFKGDTTTELKDGKATFYKIYPNEVSSHYMTGCVFLVAFPKFTSEYADKMKIISQYCGDVMIDPSLVRPWILDRLVIKAKKSKE